LKIFLTLLSSIVLVSLTGCSSSTSAIDNGPSNSASKQPTIIETPKPVVPWYPSKFRELTSEVAYKPLKVSKMDCGYSSAHSCVQIYVVTKKSCNLFVSVNFEKNAVVVDSGIDSVNVQAGEVAILTFASFDAPRYSGDTTFKITEVNCY
jgi:hypothetical protein